MVSQVLTTWVNFLLPVCPRLRFSRFFFDLVWSRGDRGSHHVAERSFAKTGKLVFRGRVERPFARPVGRSFDGDGWSASTGFPLKEPTMNSPIRALMAGLLPSWQRALADGVELDLVFSFGRSHLNYPGNAKSIAYPVGQYQELEETLVSPGVEFDLGVGDSRGIIASLSGSS